MTKFLNALALATICSSAQAGVLINFDNPTCCGFDSGIPQPMLYVDPAIIASSVTNKGVQGVNHIEMYQTNGWGSSLDTGKYISWSVAPISGKQLILRSFEIDIWQTYWTYNGAFSLRSSANDFGADLFTSSISHVDWNPTSSSYVFDFASGTTVQDSTEFRLYFNGNFGMYMIATGSPGNGFTLNGDVISAVPEPATYQLALVGIGAIGIALRRRKQLP